VEVMSVTDGALHVRKNPQELASTSGFGDAYVGHAPRPFEVDSAAHAAGVSIIGVDNEGGINTLMDHLLSLGHRKIGFVGGVFVDGRLIGDIGERRTAYLERAAAAGLDTPSKYVRDAHSTLGGGAGAFRELMAIPEPPTAIIASTDLLAIGALHQACRMGIDIPGHVSLVGFDDLPMAGYTNPRLTTMRMPTTEMAAAAVSTAINGDQGLGEATVRIFAPELIVRESSGQWRLRAARPSAVSR
jgi:DNA-binding LacI/PurR family transcriptional regulator